MKAYPFYSYRTGYSKYFLMVKPFGIFHIICGIILGFFLFIYPASIFYITLILIISYLLYKKVHDSERSFILYIFYLALFLRLALIIVTHILSAYYGFGPKSTTFPGMEGGGIIGDDMGIHQRAWALANIVKGVQLSKLQTVTLCKFNAFGWSLYVYILGFFYYLFGTVPFLGKCINALFGVLTGIIVYFIAKELFGIKTAKLACALTVFYPTLFLWSIVNLKDTLLIFLVTLSAFCYSLFQKFKQVRYLLLLLLLFFFIELCRHGIIFILMFVLFISLIVSIKWNCKKSVVAGIVGLALLINGNYYSSSVKNRITVDQLINQQKVSEATGGSTSYRIYPERFYYYGGYEDRQPINIMEFTMALVMGILSVIFRPFPWEIDNIRKMFFYPASLIYDILFFFFVVGLLISLRHHIRRSIFLILLCITVSIYLALTSGNIGTMIRLRDMVIPIYIIFSSLGIVQLLSQQQSGEVK